MKKYGPADTNSLVFSSASLNNKSRNGIMNSKLKENNFD